MKLWPNARQATDPEATQTESFGSRQIIALAISKLDDGWPESVEEQSLLLLVWSHYITRQYIKDVL